MKPALLVAGAALAIVVCCAGPAVLVGAIAGIGLSGALGGISAALIATAFAACLLTMRACRRRCSPTKSADSSRPPLASSEENR